MSREYECVWVMRVWVECEWECECAGRFNVPSRAQHLQNVFCLRLKVCYKKYFMTCKSINKKVQLHPHALPPAPIHFPHSFVGPASFIANVGTAKLRSRFILCPARYSFRFLGYVSCFFPLQLFPLRILLLCWPFGSSFYGKLHLSMC